MKKAKTQDPIDWAQKIQEHPTFEWITEHSQYLLYLFIGFICFALIGYKFLSGSAAKAESNYQLAEGYSVQLRRAIEESSSLVKQNDALEKLQQIVDKYPELHSKYDGMIAQTLLAQNKSEEAAPFINRTKKRTSDHQSPLYKEFSTSTSNLSKGDLQQALNSSLELKNQLLKEPQKSLLLPYLMIRIAMLYQGMGEKNLEKLAWDEWRLFSEGKGAQSLDPQSLEMISSLFSKGDFTLNRYIDLRLSN